ncbi:hypothetical protein SOVF_101030 [Spinacia oleracea]|nr:protein BASIC PENTACYSTEINE4-like isoform X2 [Spinacia oleracea]XP_056683312.1 protein BASIC PENTACYSTEINE4-like isoform X2 [Spinacia oleracea]KNA15123.1 hypothetical protein SOVF_101030 [Spinacia oleracea]
MMAYQHEVKEQTALIMNRNLVNMIAERDAAIEEMKRALLEKKRAFEEREIAISQRNFAYRERDEAIMERNNAYALQNCILSSGVECDNNYVPQEINALSESNNKSPQPKKTKERKPREKRTCDELKVKKEWDGKKMGLNRVDYDDSVMPSPGCSCTGVFRQCYKWGNGGWQSACCTTTVSVYPLPPVPNKRYARIGGRKMSASAFSKLLSELAMEGFDLSVPVDLKNRWSKHGTNRYITIK